MQTPQVVIRTNVKKADPKFMFGKLAICPRCNENEVIEKRGGAVSCVICQGSWTFSAYKSLMRKRQKGQ